MWECAPLTSHPVHQKDPRIGELSAVGDPPLSFIGKTRHFFFDFCFFSMLYHFIIIENAKCVNKM